MKKMLSLALAMILCLSMVTAIAENGKEYSPNWELYPKDASTEPAGILGGISAESVALAEKLNKSKDLVNDLQNKTKLLDENGAVSEAAADFVLRIPQNQIWAYKTIQATSNDGVKLITPAGWSLAQFLDATKACGYLIYQDGDQFFAYKLTLEIEDTGREKWKTYVTVPAAVLAQAQGKPVVMLFAL